MPVLYLHFLVVVWNSLPLLWRLWVVERMTAMENPDQRNDELSLLSSLKHAYSPQLAALKVLPKPNNYYWLWATDRPNYVWLILPKDKGSRGREKRAPFPQCTRTTPETEGPLRTLTGVTGWKSRTGGGAAVAVAPAALGIRGGKCMGQPSRPCGPTCTKGP